MSALIIHPPDERLEAHRRVVSARIEGPNGSQDLWFRGPRDALALRGADAFVVTCLPTAMRLGLTLEVRADVSAALLANLRTAQDILDKWHDGFQRVEVTVGGARSDDAAPGSGEGSPGRGTAAFFSGGVDSFHTALKHRDSLSALVLVHGFDMPLEDVDLRARVSEALGRAASSLGNPLVEIETNGRSLTDPHVRWDTQQFGASLAGIALLLSPVADRVLIPSSESYAHLDPCGSHPLLDPLWSTGYLTVVHDGAEATRVEKVAAIAAHPAVLESLRVCWENRDGAYNCGRCEKCIRTMLSLEAAGVLDRCTTFDAPLDPGRVARVEIPLDLMAYHFRDNLEALRTQGADPALIRAMQKALGAFEAGKLAGGIGEIPARPLLTAFVKGRAMALRRRLQEVFGR